MLCLLYLSMVGLSCHWDRGQANCVGHAGYKLLKAENLTDVAVIQVPASSLTSRKFRCMLAPENGVTSEPCMLSLSVNDKTSLDQNEECNDTCTVFFPVLAVMLICQLLCGMCCGFMKIIKREWRVNNPEESQDRIVTLYQWLKTVLCNRGTATEETEENQSLRTTSITAKRYFLVCGSLRIPISFKIASGNVQNSPDNLALYSNHYNNSDEQNADITREIREDGDRDIVIGSLNLYTEVDDRVTRSQSTANHETTPLLQTSELPDPCSKLNTEETSEGSIGLNKSCSHAHCPACVKSYNNEDDMWFALPVRQRALMIGKDLIAAEKGKRGEQQNDRCRLVTTNGKVIINRQIVEDIATVVWEDSQVQKYKYKYRQEKKRGEDCRAWFEQQIRSLEAQIRVEQRVGDMELEKAKKEGREVIRSTTKQLTKALSMSEKESASCNQSPCELISMLAQRQIGAERQVSKLSEKLQRQQREKEEQLAALKQCYEEEKKREQEKVVMFVIRVEEREQAVLRQLAADISTEHLVDVKSLLRDHNIRQMGVDSGLSFLMEAPVSQSKDVVKNNLFIQETINPDDVKHSASWNDISPCSMEISLAHDETCLSNN